MPNFSTLICEIRKLRNVRLNKNIITYFICVTIASILWFLNALNKDYSAEISYPIKYINLPEGKYLVTRLPSRLLLDVKAKGFALLGHKIRTSFLPITFNLESYHNRLTKKEHIFEYTLRLNDMKDKISNQLNTEIKLLSTHPSEIIFRFAEAQNKKVAIQPQVDYTLKRQYILNQITVNPDSITVSGPAPILDTLQYVRTAKWKVKELNKTLRHTMELLPLPNCQYSQTTAELTLEAEQFTEVKKTIPITPYGVPGNMNIRLFPAVVNISYETGLSKYDQVTDHDFVFYVDYPTDTEISYLEVKTGKVPDFIKNLTYTPQKVEYILEKK
jgi:YbbR domain-containing protein